MNILEVRKMHKNMMGIEVCKKQKMKYLESKRLIIQSETNKLGYNKFWVNYLRIKELGINKLKAISWQSISWEW